MALRQKKTVLIAGGAGEVGEGLVRAFLAEGTTVIAPSRAQDKLDALRDRMNATDRLITRPMDVSSEPGAADLHGETVVFESRDQLPRPVA